MKKASVVALVLVLGIGSALLTLGPALAQIYTDTDTNGDQTGTSSTNVTSSSNTTQTAQVTVDTFSANGRIGSLIFDTGTSIAQSTTNETTTSSSGNISSLRNDTSMTGGMSDNSTSSDNSIGTDTAAGNMTGSSSLNTTSSNQTDTSTTVAEELEPPYVLVGDWDLAVTEGNVTDFSAGFDMVHIDGTERHTHNVTNFQASNGTTVQLVEDGTTVITGTADLMKNGESMETGVNVIITIEKLNATSIAIQSEHFEGQPIYGVVDSITGEDGTDIAQAFESAREATQNALNDTGEALADFGDEVADFFNGKG